LAEGPSRRWRAQRRRRREEIGDDVVERVAARLPQRETVALELAVPPTRMRSPSRVTATLYVSSITVDSGAFVASAIGTVSE
jgi:hypothetical protein